MSVESLRISELAETAEVPVSTLRYYERIGLLPAPERSRNGYRIYDETSVELLAFIGRAKRMGIPLDQVSELIELWSTGGCQPLQDRIRFFLAEKIGEVRGQRHEMAEFEGQLESLLGRLDSSDRATGPCDLDCACVHLDVGGEDAGTSRSPTASRGEATCSLTGDLQVQRVEQWRDLIAQGDVERSHDGLRITFDRRTGIVERIACLSAEEVSCCSFFSFGIDITARAVVLRVDVPDQPEARALCERVFGPLPRTRPR
jgi:MerR family copper efflux transcriptional regulator